MQVEIWEEKIFQVYIFFQKNIFHKNTPVIAEGLPGVSVIVFLYRVVYIYYNINAKIEQNRPIHWFKPRKVTP